MKHSGGEYNMERRVYHLLRRKRGIAGGGVFHCVFDLIEEIFDGDVDIVPLLHARRVSLEVPCVDMRIRAIQMRQNLKSCNIGITDVAVAEGPNKHFVDGTDEDLLQGFVRSVVLFV